MSQLNLSTIDLLKIDTEGADLSVLKGSQIALQAGAIKVLQVESSMSPTNVRHVAFDEFNKFLGPFGYFLYGVYEQTSEFRTGQQHLRRANLVYVLS